MSDQEIKAKRRVGRPTVMTDEVKQEILTRLAKGESLRAVCRDPNMPDVSSVILHLNQNEKFSLQYARACQARADAIFEEMFEIADNGSNDWMADGENEGYRLNGEHINRSRLRVDVRKWALARMAPKKYGDRVALVGDESSAPIMQRVEVVIIDPKAE